MKTIARLIAVLLLGGAAVAAVPAAANEKLPSAASSAAYKGRFDAKLGQYCLRPTGADALRTGTRIRSVECKTQGQWAAEGLKVTRN